MLKSRFASPSTRVLKMVEAARKYRSRGPGGHVAAVRAALPEGLRYCPHGQLGEVLFARTWIYSNEPRQGIGNPPDAHPPEGLDWDLWLGPAQERPFNPNRFVCILRPTPTSGGSGDYAGGHITDSGVHMNRYSANGVRRRPCRRQSRRWGANSGSKTIAKTPDTMQVTYEYPGFTSSWSIDATCRCGSRAADGHDFLRKPWNALRRSQSLPLTPEKGLGCRRAK